MLQIGRNSWFGYDIGDDAEDFTFASVLDIYDLATIQEYLLFTGGLHYPFDREKIWRASCTWLRNNTEIWKPWVKNTYTPGEYKMDPFFVGVIFFTCFIVLLSLIYSFHHFGFAMQFQDTLLGAFMISAA